MSISSKVIGITKSGRPRYKQHYRVQWESMPQCQGWLMQHPETEVMAFCKVCKTSVQAHKKDILRHSSCKKHKQNFEKASGFTSFDYVINTEEDSQDDEYRIIKYDDDDDEDNGVYEGVYVEHAGEDTLILKEHEAVALSNDDPSLKKSKGIKIKTENTNNSFNIYSKKKPSMKNKNMEYKTIVQQCTRWCCSFPEAPPVYEDSFSVFGKFVSNEIRNITDEYEKQKVKMKINMIIFNAFIGQYDSQESEESRISEQDEVPRLQLADQQEDQLGGFGKYIATELRSVRSKGAQMIAKQKICSIVYKSVNGTVSMPESPPINTSFS